jgi:hypothetical protein
MTTCGGEGIILDLRQSMPLPATLHHQRDGHTSPGIAAAERKVLGFPPATLPVEGPADA